MGEEFISRAFGGRRRGQDTALPPASTWWTASLSYPPVRRRLQGLPDFVINRGGNYYFVPGIRALRWLGDLSGWARPVFSGQFSRSMKEDDMT
ncbi:MAG: hypothetical protein ACRDTR_04545, partial [Rubrobacter sp.]